MQSRTIVFLQSSWIKEGLLMKKLGVYIHIPFCAHKCSYCDFYSLSGCDKLMPKYQHALLRHIKESSSQLSEYYIDTVYFGGGTPSYYGADRLVELFDSLKQNCNVLIDSEVTAEVNPDSITKDALIKLCKAGFNRISIGVQSADDATLKRIGRTHNFAACERAVENARIAGFKNISVDLIYGLPSQSAEDWSKTLTRILALKPEHISCYGLKISDNTEMAMYKNSPFLPDDDAQADMYLYAAEILAKFGYRQYEISNFSKPGFESLHNLKYWTCNEYIGFGAAAHSYLGSLRYSNISDIEKYIDGIVSGHEIIDYNERINAFERASEYLMLGLRTVHGISEAEYKKIYPLDFSAIEAKLKICEKHNWAVRSGDRWHFTPKGFLVSNILIGQVLDAHSEQDFNRPHPWMQNDFERTPIKTVDAFNNSGTIFRGL